jgi:hypothetical protein
MPSKRGAESSASGMLRRPSANVAEFGSAVFRLLRQLFMLYALLFNGLSGKRRFARKSNKLAVMLLSVAFRRACNRPIFCDQSVVCRVSGSALAGTRTYFHKVGAG